MNKSRVFESDLPTVNLHSKMAKLVTLLAFLCMIGELSALSNENSAKVVVFGERDFEVKADEGAIESNSVLWRTTKGQKPIAVKVEDVACGCSGSLSFFRCQCCIEIKIVVFNMQGCVSFTFSPSAKIMEFTANKDGNVIFKKTISVSVNMPVKFCRDFQIYGKDSKICVGLSDISFQKTHTGACIYTEINYELIHWKQKLRCLYKDVQPRIGSNRKLKVFSFS